VVYADVIGDLAQGISALLMGVPDAVGRRPSEDPCQRCAPRIADADPFEYERPIGYAGRGAFTEPPEH